MQNFHIEDIRLRTKIHAIQHSKTLSQQQKIHQISILKTLIPQGTDSSQKTILNITNCMVGSSMIIYPILFIKSGIIISPMVMIIVAAIQYITCRLLVIHNRPDQPTFNQSILRIGGMKVDKINSIVNMILFFFICVAYFILIVHNFYQITAGIMASFINYTPAQASQITLSKYSLQYATIIMALLLKSIYFKRQMDFIVKLMGYSMYCIAAYAIFILLNLFRHIIEGNIHLSQYRFFNSDFSSIAGAFALSFLVHPMAAPILKRNINLDNNNRDLMFGYICGAFVCFYVGFVGSLSCAPVVPKILEHPQRYSTVFDCVNLQGSADDKVFYYLGKLVQTGVLFQNFSILPILIFLTRNQYIRLAAKPKNKQQTFIQFTWFTLIFSAIISFLAIDVSLILSLDGAVIGFFIVYGIPIYIHIRCLYHKYTEPEDKSRKQLLQSLLNQSLLGQGQHELELESQALQCNKHEPVKKQFTYIFYGFLLCCGIAMGFFKLSAFFG